MGFQLIGDEELLYIQHEWSSDFDFQGRLALEAAAKHGRAIDMGQREDNSRQHEDDLLEQAALDAELNPELLRSLIELRQRDFPSLDKWGSKSAFEAAIGDLVRKAAAQAEQAVRS